jgi:hypothetical protein
MGLTFAERCQHVAGMTTKGLKHGNNLVALAATRDAARTTLISAKAAKETADANFVAAQLAYDNAAAAWSSESTLVGH